MSKKATFKAASASFGMYGGFFKDVSEQVGLEKTAALHANQGKKFGAHFAGALKEELGRKKLNVATLESVYGKMLDLFGIMPRFQRKRSTLSATVSQCPIYEGLSSAGLDHKTIELMCSQMAAAEYEVLRNVFPNLSGCVKFRSAPDQACVEELVVTK
jgi:hypothetical protein